MDQIGDIRRDFWLGRQANLDPGAPSRSSDDLHAAAGGIDASSLRGEPDVAFGDSGAELGEVDSTAVVLDDEEHLSVVFAQLDRKVRRTGMLRGVRDQLARRRIEDLVEGRRHLRLQGEVKDHPRSFGCALRSHSDSSRKPDLIQDVWVELEDRFPQVAQGLGDRMSARVSAGCSWMISSNS